LGSTAEGGKGFSCQLQQRHGDDPRSSTGGRCGGRPRLPFGLAQMMAAAAVEHEALPPTGKHRAGNPCLAAGGADVAHFLGAAPEPSTL